MAVQRKTEPDPQDRSRELQELLEVNRRRLEDQIARLNTQLKATPEVEAGGDVGDRAEHGLDQDISARTLEQLTRMLQATQQALARHEQGDYGYCQSCGNAIPLARLRAMPFTLYCRDCQEKAEGPSPRTPPRL